MKTINKTMMILLAAAAMSPVYAQVQEEVKQKSIENLTSLAKTEGSSDNRKNLTLKSGKVLKHAYILSRKPNGVNIAHDDGASFYKFSDMPEEVQKIFKYDQEEAAAYEKKVEKSKKAAAKKEEADRQKKEQAMKESADRIKNEKIFKQQASIKEMELRLAELERRAATMDRHIEENRRDKVSLAGIDNRGGVVSVWGGGLTRIRGNNQTAGVVNDMRRENKDLEPKRDNIEVDIINLKLKIDAEKYSLEKLMKTDSMSVVPW